MHIFIKYTWKMVFVLSSMADSRMLCGPNDVGYSFDFSKKKNTGFCIIAKLGLYITYM